MVTSLVSPSVKDAEQEPGVDAPRPRRQPKPSKKKLEDLENTQRCEEPKRKKTRKEPETEEGQNLKEPSTKQKKLTRNQRCLKKRTVCLRRGRLLTLKILRIVDSFQQQILKGCRIYQVEGSMRVGNLKQWRSKKGRRKIRPTSLPVQCSLSQNLSHLVYIYMQHSQLFQRSQLASVQNHNYVQQTWLSQQPRYHSLQIHFSKEISPAYHTNFQLTNSSMGQRVLSSHQSSHQTLALQHSPPLHLITNQLHLLIQPQDFSSLQHHRDHLIQL